MPTVMAYFELPGLPMHIIPTHWSLCVPPRPFPHPWLTGLTSWAPEESPDELPDKLEVGVGELSVGIEVPEAEPLFVVVGKGPKLCEMLFFFFDPSTPPTTAMMMTMTRMAIAIMMIPFLVV